MEKFSVKKPFTILVAVIMVLLLGFVSITNLQTNLLPDISTPYLMVVTVYPGASPERVESEVSDVMENALGTVSGVESITATSAENYSLLLMKFAEGTDMNSAMVKTSNKVDQTATSLPGTCLTPSIIEYSLNMNAFMTVAVSREGSDVYDLSDFVDNTLVPYVGRTSGVSSVSANGLIEKMVQVQLNQDKIDEVNARLLELIDTQLADARAQLDAAEAQIAAGRAEYEKQLKNFGNTVSDTVMAQMGTEVADAVTVVRDQAQAFLSSINQLIGVVNEPEIQQALIDVRDGLQRVVDQFNQTGMRDIDSLIEIVGELRDITDKLTNALQELQGRLGTSDGTVSDNDSVIFFNFRPDRAREITRAIVDPDFTGFQREFFPTTYVCNTEYDASMPNVLVAWPRVAVKNGLGEYLSSLSLTQLRIAETEKYAHVTFFFNGGVEKQYPGEDRVLVPSPKVATYDLQPEMSAYEVCDKCVERINSGAYDVVILNFANCDMVGHTGVLEAAVKAVETVDTCVGRVVEATLKMGGIAMITADHGNAEVMRQPDGSPMTAHTTNPVPFILCGAGTELRTGRLADIAPTILDVMGLACPPEMDGKSLIVR